jgi:xylulokinase
MSRESPCLLACDLGTGGNKASLYEVDGSEIATVFVPYATHYPAAGYHEQAPEDWWQAVVTGVSRLIDQAD